MFLTCCGHSVNTFFFFSSYPFITEVCRKLTFFLKRSEENYFSSHFNYIAIWMRTWLLFEEEKPPAHGRDDNMIWARGSCRIKVTSYWAWAGPEVPNDYVLNDTFPPQNLPHSPQHPLPFPPNTRWKIKKKHSVATIV